MEAVENKNQTITLYTAYARHQNSITERKTRDLQEQARKNCYIQ